MRRCRAGRPPVPPVHLAEVAEKGGAGGQRGDRVLYPQGIQLPAYPDTLRQSPEPGPDEQRAPNGRDRRPLCSIGARSGLSPKSAQSSGGSRTFLSRRVPTSDRVLLRVVVVSGLAPFSEKTRDAGLHHEQESDPPCEAQVAWGEA